MDSTATKPQLQDVERLEKFNGLNYKRWSMKMIYQLTVAKVVYVLTTAYPQEKSTETEDATSQSSSQIQTPNAESQTLSQSKWIEDDYVCRFMILNAISNSLFNVFHLYKAASELWTSLKCRYVNEDAGNKSFLVNKYIDFKFVDTKPIIDQVNELNDIATQCATAGESISETFQVTTIIGKLPSSWKDYQKILKDKKKSLNLDQLLQHIQIESEARNRDAPDKTERNSVHTVEGNSMKKKFVKGKAKKPEADVIGKDLVAMLNEVLMVNLDENWWLDSGATCHVTPHRNVFKTYEAIADGKTVFMGNSSTSVVMGVGTVELPLSSGKIKTYWFSCYATYDIL
ncbi:uncharacterized protein LOC120276045 [Dioscorea cayenensis subsp. rotundata]|uniref:Uncharacterized protein LOC120276045 n=1 Tax=Dioscorea cayennensis subsp. rotundata TaxID=55577 RepID=A0AB40CGM7_DIOCR|nr:uncharacterized protein LOC120276045 [Dioscorea cayenensis subsp. rotundata]